jgi:hypothetical protein
MTLYGYYIQMTFFSRDSQMGILKIGILVVPKLWTLISSSNQAFFEHVKTLFYNLQKYLSKVYHMPQLEIIWPLL